MRRGAREITKGIFDTVQHRGKTIRTSLHNRTLANLRNSVRNSTDVDVGYVPLGYENRPDKISTAFYNTPDLWWLLMITNGIVDPFEGFKVKEKIIIPKL